MRTALMPTVSVILPARNAERTIDAAVASVLQQSFSDFELIAVDDASSDGTLARLRGAAARDGRVRVLTGEGRGTTAAINHGVAIAVGRYIARQDADDVSMPRRFERQVAALDARARLCGVGTAAQVIDEAGAASRQLPMRYGAAAVKDGLQTARVSPVHGSMMIRRDRLDEVGGYRSAFVASQDYDLWLRLVERWDIDNIAEPLYGWRLTANSIYAAHRQAQLLYSGVALAFSAERARFGGDSYSLLEACGGDLETFAGRYRLEGMLQAIWGDLLFRGLGDAQLASRHLKRAVRRGYIRPRALLLGAWALLGLPWPGSRPLGYRERSHRDS
jgi:glycosyltransferase involved in cell wall biosynthesis